MPELNIFCGPAYPKEIVKFLREGVAPHHLIQSQIVQESPWFMAIDDPALHEAEVVLGQPTTESVLASKRVKWFHITSAGYTRYDTPEFRQAAAERNMIVTNSSQVLAEPCAEQILSFMLAQARRLPAALEEARNPGNVPESGWRPFLRCLLGQEAIIYGFGTIATRLRDLLAPFGMKMTAVRRQQRGDEGMTVLTPETSTAALGSADHVINILPDHASTRGFFSAELFGKMKPGAIFYNMGRGTTVDQQALATALQQKHLQAAWLDVTDPEPLPKNNVLWSAPNCFITPHTGGGNLGNEEAFARHFLENFKRYIQGRPLQDRVM